MHNWLENKIFDRCFKIKNSKDLQFTAELQRVPMVRGCEFGSSKEMSTMPGKHRRVTGSK